MSNISGFQNFTPQQHLLFNELKTVLENTFSLHGFSPFYPRPVELIKDIAQKGGEDKQMYILSKLQNATPTNLALPFDRTVPLAIYVADHISKINYPFKRYDISYSFRGERPQAGRLRGFIQADVDIIDHQMDWIYDFQCMYALVDALKKMHVPKFKIAINHIEISKAILEYFHIPPHLYPAIFRILDKFDKISFDQSLKELERLLNSSQKANDLYSVFRHKITLQDLKQPPFEFNNAHSEAFYEIEMLLQTFQGLGFLIEFCPYMVRGLDYYTGIVFETFLEDYLHYGSVASGGRYKSLVSTFTQKTTDLMGVGGSIGFSRLFDILIKENLLAKDTKHSAHVMICAREKHLLTRALQLSCFLQKNAIKTDLLSGPKRKIKHHLEIADKKGCNFIAMVMTPETFVVKNLYERTQQESKTFEEVQYFIQKAFLKHEE